MLGYGGTMNFSANMNLLKEVPDFDYNLRFTDLQLVKLNDLAREYANVDFDRGTVSVYSEMAMLQQKAEWLHQTAHEGYADF